MKLLDNARMKNKKNILGLKIVYGLLLVLSLNFVLKQGLDSLFFHALWKGEADPFGFMMFVLMGFYPISFFLSNLILKRKLTALDWVLTGLGFLFGAFALYPSYFREYERKEWTTSIKPTFLVWIGLGLTLMFMVYGMMLGETQTYTDAFAQDTMIHIMTLDFIALTILSILIAKEHTRFWRWALIPLVGWWAILLD